MVYEDKLIAFSIGSLLELLQAWLGAANPIARIIDRVLISPGSLAKFLPLLLSFSRQISRLARVPLPRYDMTDVREITFKSPIFERFVRISSCMPSAK
jgi:hypothetical protein